MDKSKIPTTKIKLGDREIEVYQWMTQEEEDQYLNTLTGDKEMSLSSEMEMQTSYSTLAKARNFMVQTLCKDFTFEEFNILSPDLRKELDAELAKIVNKKKSSPLESLSPTSKEAGLAETP